MSKQRIFITDKFLNIKLRKISQMIQGNEQEVILMSDDITNPFKKVCRIYRRNKYNRITKDHAFHIIMFDYVVIDTESKKPVLNTINPEGILKFIDQYNGEE